MKKLLGILGTLILSGILACVLIVVLVQTDNVSRMTSVESVHDKPVAMVLGAALQADGKPSEPLAGRLSLAVRLYKEGRVKKLLITGDDGQFHTNEVAAMEKFVLAQGVTSTDLMVDGHGYRTYESCKRAVQVYGLTEAVVVTSRNHLGRSLYLCEHLGMRTIGVSSPSTHGLIFDTRELLASVKAFIDIEILAPQPPVAIK